MLRITLIGLSTFVGLSQAHAEADYRCAAKAPFGPDDIFEWANCDWIMSHPQDCREAHSHKLMRCRIVCEDVDDDVVIPTVPVVVPNTCDAKKLDLVFVVDGSGSVQAANFELQKTFIHDVLDELDYGVDASRVSIVQFSDREELEILNSASKAAVDDTVNNLVYHDGQATYTGAALEFTNDQVFRVASRADAVQVMILLTDGTSHDAIEAPVEQLKNRGVVSIAVGVGAYDINQLRTIASREELILEAVDFASLGDVTEMLTQLVCDDGLVGLESRG